MKMLLVGYFLVKFVDPEGDGTYNILLEQTYPTKGNLVATWSKIEGEFEEGSTLNLVVHGDCTKVYEIREGNGKMGSSWAPEDDWYVYGRSYICNADKVEVISE